jgi:hypothetical protein
MKSWIKFNLNDYVKVKLTDKGKEMLKKYYKSESLDWLDGDHEGDGWYRFQLHALASIFGEELHFGSCSQLPFETGIYLKVDQKEES